MNPIQFGYKNKSKKITIAKNLNPTDLVDIINHSFKLNQQIIGFVNAKGQFLSLEQFPKSPLIQFNDIFYLVTAQDMNEDNMSFASDHYDKSRKCIENYNKSKKANNYVENKNKINKATNQVCNTKDQSDIPEHLEGFYQGVIGNLQIFEELLLEDNVATVLFCFVKEKPKNINFPYYLYHTSKNSAIVYIGHLKVCQFFICNMAKIPSQIQLFIRSIIKPEETKIDQHKINYQKQISQPEQDEQFIQPVGQQNQVFLGNDVFDDEFKQSHPILKNQEEQLKESQQQQEKQQSRKEQQMISSLLQNLLKLRDDQQITELQFYKMKSELLQSLSDFLRKYQMGTRKGFRNHISHQINFPSKTNLNNFSANQQSNNFLTNQQSKNYPPQSSYNNYMSGANGTHEQMMKRPKGQKNTRKQLNNRQKNKISKNDKQQTQKYGYRDQNAEIYRSNEIENQGERDQLISQSKNQYRSTYSRQTKKYQIPIIVRKYNNVIEKISTSYPLTQEQQQAINLILQLQLKGLISEKESGIYKTSVLQEDPDILPLFLDYFDGFMDQIELVSKLKMTKKVNSQKKQRGEHNMRLLIKYAKQSSYETLRNLLLEKNQHLINSLEKYRSDRNSELLAERLEKIAQFEKQKLLLDHILN